MDETRQLLRSPAELSSLFQDALISELISSDFSVTECLSWLLGAPLDMIDYCQPIDLNEIEMVKVTCNLFQI